MHVLIASCLVATLSTAVVPVLDMDGHGNFPALTFPDGSPVPFAPRRSVPGSSETAPAIPNGAALSPPPPVAETPAKVIPKGERRKQRIDDLLTRLAQAKDQAEADAVNGMLANLRLQSGSDTADLLMTRAMAAIGGKDNKTALVLLDKILALQPGWAEAWNKRATVRYLEDDDAGSMEDISHVLVLEPHHFGALSGMGFILHRNGEDKAALTVLRQAAAVNPHSPDIKGLIDQLTPEIEGHDL